MLWSKQFWQLIPRVQFISMYDEKNNETTGKKVFTIDMSHAVHRKIKVQRRKSQVNSTLTAKAL